MPQPPHHSPPDQPGLGQPAVQPELATTEAPFPYPKINWEEWEEWHDAFPITPQAAPAAEGDPPLSPPTAPAPPPAFPIRDAEELNLYHLQGLLLSTHSELAPALPDARQQIAATLRYLEEKDLARAEVVRRCVQMAAYLVEEAASLLNEGIHWPTVEAHLCPPQETFWDTPQQWLAIGQAQATPDQAADAQTAPDQATDTTPTDAAAVAAPPDVAGAAPPEAPEIPPALAALMGPGLPPLSPARAQAARRSLGLALRLDRESEQRRFYAIACAHGLPTGPEAAPAIRAALSDLFGIPLESRRELTTRQWGQAASAIETEDLTWQVAPLPSQKPSQKMAPPHRVAAPQCNL